LTEQVTPAPGKPLPDALDGGNHRRTIVSAKLPGFDLMTICERRESER
jgi:hypothetical protein